MVSGIFILFEAAATIFFYSRRRGRLPLPPGPPPNFWTGNAHQLSVKERALAGVWPIFSFRVPNRQFIVFSSLEAVTKLLDAHATTYSDRPKVWMIELAKRHLNPFSISYHHPYFKAYRTAFQNSLSARALRKYQSVQTEECRVLLDALHKNPDHFVDHIRRNTGAIILYVTYGWKVTDNDPLVSMLQATFDSTAKINVPGRLVGRRDAIFCPTMSFKRTAIEHGKRMSRVDTLPFNWTKQQIQNGSYTCSFVSEQLLPEDGSTVSAQQEDITMRCSQGIYIGGFDTTVSFTKSFILAMVLYPEVQKLAQAEIDAVVSQDQIPTFEDRDKLPYIEALALELIRWGLVSTNAGAPHHAMREDIYEGYRIPKDAVIIVNLVSISRDKEIYPDPLVFRPERFLGPPKALLWIRAP
ncbi:cytochrome P450 [Suillus occidentalis]|nr:cytochrome P450 [Suillus occidentalis]